MAEIGVYIICLNEEKYIRATLDSVKGFAQIVVVDSGSTDGTLDIIRDCIAKGYPIELFERVWTGYADQKQFALEKLRTEWALNLDADEYLEDGCLENIASTLRDNPQAYGIRVMVKVSLPGWGVCHHVHQGMHLRLFRREGAHYLPNIIIHERLAIGGPVVEARGPGFIDRKTLPFNERAKKEIAYGYLKARMLYESGQRPRPLRLIFYPSIYFWRKYLLHRFFTAGWSGFIYCIGTAFYVIATEVALIEMHRTNKNA